MNLENISKIRKFFCYEAVHLLNCFLETNTEEEYESTKEEFNFRLNEEHGNFNIPHINKGKMVNYCRLAWDNKVTFEVIQRSGLKLYYQFYDNRVRVGTEISERNFNPEEDYIEIL